VSFAQDKSSITITQMLFLCVCVFLIFRLQCGDIIGWTTEKASGL